MFKFRHATVKEGIFAEIPLARPGRLYVSPMPYGPYDRFNRLMRIYRRHRVKEVAVLVSAEEADRKARRDLFAAYRQVGIRVYHYPIVDLTAPRMGEIDDLLNKLAHALEHDNLAIHCNAGIGRTGIVSACLVQKVKGLSGDESLEYVQKYMHISLTEEQKRFVLKWAAAQR